MRSQIIDEILDVLDMFGVDTSDIRKKRQDAIEAVGAFNEVNKTSITLEEYNNLMNPSNIRKISSAGSNIWSATFGYDSATKGDVDAISSSVKGANKYAEKVRKKLNTVVSSIWQHFGKDDFNYSEAVDGEGNELTGKKKLNVNNLKFTSLMGNIISEIITLLNNEDEQVAMDVYSNVTDLTGFYDSRTKLKDLYKEGKNNPKSQFSISDEHATFKRIRAIAGICSIFNYIFKPLGKQYDVTSIIVSKLIPAYFTSSESDTKVIDWANETFEPTTTTPDAVFTVGAASATLQGGGTTGTQWANGHAVRIYKGKTLTLSVTGGTLYSAKVTIDNYKAEYCTAFEAGVTGGTWIKNEDRVYTVTATAETIVISAAANQIRINSIAVSYVPAA